MFYEEKLVDGVLYCRSSPYDEWEPKRGAYADAVRALCALKDDERVGLTRWFCGHCGILEDPKRPCQCWNDE